MDDEGIPYLVSKVDGTSKRRNLASFNHRARRPRIVIADDDPISLMQIRDLLGTRFDVVARAANGRECVEAVQRLSPSVAVTDITMPEMNGIEAARQITRMWPEVKVVILSAYSDEAFIDAAFDAGASAYVLKLGGSLKLVSAIEEVLAGRSYRPEGFGQ